MKESEILDKFDHDFVATIRNFKIAEELFSGETPDVRLATDLLKASIEQLEELRRDLPKTVSQKKDWDHKPSLTAQK